MISVTAGQHNASNRILTMEIKPFLTSNDQSHDADDQHIENPQESPRMRG
jgi:hypothetical protein